MDHLYLEKVHKWPGNAVGKILHTEAWVEILVTDHFVGLFGSIFTHFNLQFHQKWVHLFVCLLILPFILCYFFIFEAILSVLYSILLPNFMLSTFLKTFCKNFHTIWCFPYVIDLKSLGL